MSVYNLHLLDECRDPRVIARVMRLTALPARVVRRELARPPFLLLREQPLSRAVAVRRELEQLGLSLRLERVEEPTGDQRHPLAGDEAPDEGEIVLEEGSGFREVVEGEEPEPAVARARERRRLPWLIAGLTAVALLALLLVLALPAKRPFAPGNPLDRAVALLRVELPAQAARLRALLDGPDAPADCLARAAEDAGRLEQLAHGVWNRLPEALRGDVEELQSLRLTLDLRRESAAMAAERQPQPGPEGDADRDGAPLAADFAPLEGPSLIERFDSEIGRVDRPSSSADQQRLERLLRSMDRLRAGGAFPGAAELDDRLARAGADADVRLRARALAGSVQRKGLRWVPAGDGVAGRADLPDATRIDVVDEGGALHRATIEDGRLRFEGSLEGWRPIAARLAPLDQQPAALQRVLEAGLRLFAPEVYFATLPGSTLARQRPAVAETALAEGDARRLREALLAEGLGRIELDERGGLRGEAADGRDLLELVQAVAAIYREARHWPDEIELSRGTERWRLSGCELWILSRGAGSAG